MGIDKRRLVPEDQIEQFLSDTMALDFMADEMQRIEQAMAAGSPSGSEPC